MTNLDRDDKSFGLFRLFQISVLIGLLMLVGSTFTILRTERETNIFDEIMPKHKNGMLGYVLACYVYPIQIFRFSSKLKCFWFDSINHYCPISR